MDKAYSRINWEDYPSGKTPINEQNLNKIDCAVDEIDNRVITLDNTKATKVEVSTLFKEVSYDEQTGIITFTRKNGAAVTIDTPMEKIALNIYYDPVTEMLTLPLIDGTQMQVDLSRLITEYEFVDSDTMAFSVRPDGKVTATVKEGSIEEKHLRPDYLADIRVVAAKAEKSAEDASGSASDAAERATEAESWAHGGTGKRPGEDTDNAMAYAEKAKEYSDDWKGSLLPQGTVPFSQLPTSGNVAGHLYNVSNAFVTDARFKDGAGYSYPAGTNVFWTQDGKWDCLSGNLTRELTQAEYDALPEAEKMNGTIYFIPDGDNSVPGASGTTPGLVVVDTALSLQSENPVQNKAVTAALNGKAPTASPTFTGTPKAPTAPANTNSTQIATTGFVKQVVSGFMPVSAVTEPVNFDNMKTPGVYRLQASCTGLPMTNWGTVYVDGTGGSTYQIYIPDSRTMSLYKRGCAGPSGAWSEWKELNPESISGNAATTDKWKTSRNINGMLVDGAEDRVNYGVCSTAASTKEKVVPCPGFALKTGSEITVKFANAMFANNATLNVNDTGAKPIYYHGSAIPYGFLKAKYTYTFRYNGEQYELVGSVNDTWQANSSTAEGYVSASYGRKNVVWGTNQWGDPDWINPVDRNVCTISYAELGKWHPFAWFNLYQELDAPIGMVFLVYDNMGANDVGIFYTSLSPVYGDPVGYWIARKEPNSDKTKVALVANRLYHDVDGYYYAATLYIKPEYPAHIEIKLLSTTEKNQLEVPLFSTNPVTTLSGDIVHYIS